MVARDSQFPYLIIFLRDLVGRRWFLFNNKGLNMYKIKLDINLVLSDSKFLFDKQFFNFIFFMHYFILIKWFFVICLHLTNVYAMVTQSISSFRNQDESLQTEA